MILMLGWVSYIFYVAEGVSTNISSLVCFVVIFLVIMFSSCHIFFSIPRRINNYKNFNFERACYATVIRKYLTFKKTSKNVRRTVHKVDLKINEDKFIKGLIVGRSKYNNTQVGDKVIVVSYDGHCIHVIDLKR